MIEHTQLEFDFGIGLGETPKPMSLEDQIHDRFWRISEAIITMDDREAGRQLRELKVIVLDLLDQTLQR